MKRLPARYAPMLFGLFLSGFMSLLVSGIATLRVVGPSLALFPAWMTSWMNSWLVAFPVVLFVAPMVRKLVAKLTLPPG